ncbi:divalent cation tolerance protein CutA, partial [Micromonospora parastrephiae]
MRRFGRSVLPGVAGRLAACAQVGGQVDSTYWWRSGV